MQGKIIKGIAGFYYVHVEEDGVYECRAKGIFRKNSQKPLVGDDVSIDCLSGEERTGNITRLLARKNELARPAVANIDQALILFSPARPAPNLNLLDRFLIMMERQGLPSVICFNKQDLITEEEKTELKAVYEGCGSKVLCVSALRRQGTDELWGLLKHKTTALAGPSGVGKSSLINLLQPNVKMETGALSEKLGRGKHTTRHTELIAAGEGTYLMDTPGFSSLNLEGMEKEELKEYYPEFEPYARSCRFQGCVHIHEPDCAVKAALDEGKINRIRYENYSLFYEELKNRRKY